MIIFLNQKVSYKFLLPKKFKYFTTNPELLEELSYTKETVSLNINCYQKKDYYEEIINLQNDLISNKLNKFFNPNSINFGLNFEITKKKYYSFLSKELIKKYGDQVTSPQKLNIHKSLTLYLFFILQKINFSVYVFFLIIPATFSLVRFVLTTKKTLVISSQNHFKFIKKNFGKSNYFLLSKKFQNKNTIDLDTLFILFKYVSFIPLFIKLIVELKKFQNKKNIKYKITSLYYNYCLYHFAKFINSISKFRLITTSNYRFGESFLNTNTDSILINHGAYYIDNNKLINELWKFQSQTMFSNKGLIVSTSINDKNFLNHNMSKFRFKLLKNTIRENVYKIKKLNSKIILIADTFKVDNTLRPYLYHDVNLYIKFIATILDHVPKDFKVILRHRKGTIISDNFLKRKFQNLAFSSNNSIYDDFELDPILISYSSTTLMEGKMHGLRTICFDSFKSNLNFLSSKLFNDVKKLPSRYNYYINSSKNLKEYFKLLK